MGANIGTTMKMAVFSASVAPSSASPTSQCPFGCLPLLFMRNGARKPSRRLPHRLRTAVPGTPDHLKFAVPALPGRSVGRHGRHGPCRWSCSSSSASSSRWWCRAAARPLPTWSLCQHGNRVRHGRRIRPGKTSAPPSPPTSRWWATSGQAGGRSHLVFKRLRRGVDAAALPPGTSGLLAASWNMHHRRFPFDDPCRREVWRSPPVSFNLANTLLFIGFIPFLVNAHGHADGAQPHEGRRGVPPGGIDTLTWPLSPEVSRCSRRARRSLKFGRITASMLGPCEPAGW